MEGPKLSDYHITTVENPNDLKASLIYGNIIVLSLFNNDLLSLFTQLKTEIFNLF